MVIIMFNELRILDAKKVTEEGQKYIDDQLSKVYPELKTSKHFSSKKELLDASHSELVEELRSKLQNIEIIDDIINKMSFPKDVLEQQSKEHLFIKMSRLLTFNIEIFAIMNGRGDYDLFAGVRTSRIFETSYTREQSNFTITMLDGSKLKPFVKEYREHYSYNNKPEKQLNDLLLSDELQKYMSEIVTTNNEFSNGITNLCIDRNLEYFGDKDQAFKVSFRNSSISCDLSIDEVVREAQEVQNVMRQCNEFLIQKGMYKD